MKNNNYQKKLKKTDSIRIFGYSNKQNTVGTTDPALGENRHSNRVDKLSHSRNAQAEHLEKCAKQQTSKGNWDSAISLFREFYETSSYGSSEIILSLYHSAANAAINNRVFESAELHCRLLALSPTHANGLRNFAIVLRRLQDFEAAKKFIQIYLESNPRCIHGLNTFGTILSDLGQHDTAIDIYKSIIEQDPNYADANSNLANEFHLQAGIDLAYTYSSRAILSSPNNLDIWLDHLTQLRRVCSFDRLEKIDWWSLLRTLNNQAICSIFLQALVLAESRTDQFSLLDIIKSWGDRQSALVSKQDMLPLSDIPVEKNLPLRIGFVSADFRDHSVARFIWPLFQYLDRSKFELYCYSTYTSLDSWRAKFSKAATVLRDIGHLSPRDMCQTIRGDRVHILFDLTGFTKGSRTQSFAWRAARIQVGWLGFPGTTGIKEIDYIFLDQYLKPSDLSLIREAPLISPGTTVCFSEIDEVPITPIIPEKVRGHLTLGTLNNSYKITRSTIARWASVLQRLPTAHFLFVRREFRSYHLRENIIREFARHNIMEERLHFFDNRSAKRHYLDCYNEIDFTLDTYPVTGGTTTTDALWMGVPVVGMEGQNVHQRICSAILHHAGHPEWIAKTDEEFIQIAVNLALDQDKRSELRQSLRQELKQSSLCNAKQFADDFASTMESLRNHPSHHP